MCALIGDEQRLETELVQDGLQVPCLMACCQNAALICRRQVSVTDESKRMRPGILPIDFFEIVVGVCWFLMRIGVLSTERVMRRVYVEV